MVVAQNPEHYVAYKGVVLLHTRVHANELAVLLYAPDSPQKHIGLVHFLDADLNLLALHECADSLFGGLHHIVVLGEFVVGQGQAGQGNELVACTALEPGVSCQHIVFVLAVHDELVCTVHQGVVEIVARCADVHLELCQFCQCLGVNLAQACTEDYAFALLDVELEIAGHVEVFVACIAAFLLLGVFNALVPVGGVNEVVLLVQLHEQFGIAFVHAGADTALHLVVLAGSEAVLVGVLANAAEGQEGLQAQSGFAVCIHQSVTDNDAVLEVLEHLLFLQNHTTHAIDCCGNFQ